jgi:hypothetical protein
VEDVSATPGSDCRLNPGCVHGKRKRDAVKRAPTWEGERLLLVDFGLVGFLGDLGRSWELRTVPPAA